MNDALTVVNVFWCVPDKGFNSIPKANEIIKKITKQLINVKHTKLGFKFLVVWICKRSDMQRIRV